MVKKLSKTKLIKSIIDYVFDKYCDDENIAVYAQDYYDLERLAAEKKARKNEIMMSKCHDKCHDKVYKIRKSVRDFLEPLVDAEYFKITRYKKSQDDLTPLYSAMELLETKQHKKLMKKIERGK